MVELNKGSELKTAVHARYHKLDFQKYLTIGMPQGIYQKWEYA